MLSGESEEEYGKKGAAYAIDGTLGAVVVNAKCNAEARRKYVGRDDLHRRGDEVIWSRGKVKGGMEGGSWNQAVGAEESKEIGK